MKKPFRARDLMRREAETVREDDGLWRLIRLLAERHITGAPVPDASGRLTGVVSQTDIVRWLERSGGKEGDFYAEPELDGVRARVLPRVRDLMTRRGAPSRPATCSRSDS